MKKTKDNPAKVGEQNPQKLKGRVNQLAGSGVMRNNLNTNAKIQIQQNYMRGYSPSKPLWK